jgi:hypothetical protein
MILHRRSNVPPPSGRHGSMLRLVEETQRRFGSRGERNGRRERVLCQRAAAEHREQLDEKDAHPGLWEFAMTCHAPWPAIWHHVAATIGAVGAKPLKHATLKAKRAARARIATEPVRLLA